MFRTLILTRLIGNLLFAVAFTSFTLTATAQSPPPNRKAPPPPPPPAATDQQQFLSYWTTETGWRTELQLRNNQVDQNLTVTPVLRTADGIETPLSSVVVQPPEVKTVDLATAIGSSAPQLIGTFGSVALRYHTPSEANLYAVSMVMGVGHSIAFHIDATGEDQTQDVGSREGVWWLPNGTANDYLILTNQGRNSLQLRLSLFHASGKASIQNLTLPPRGMNRLSVRQLATNAGLGGSYGGIKVSAANHAGSLDTLHFLFDETAGFSAILKMFDYNPTAKLEERDYAKTSVWTLRAPMLALSNPDPALAFPLGTTLQPQLFLRNTTAKPMDAALRFNWRTAGTTGKAPGPTLRLSPFETRRIDVAALQDGKTLPQNAQWASVTLTTSGLPDELMAVAASYDATLHYGAQTPFSDQLAFHWAGSMWQYDPYHNSIITAGNGGTQPTQAAVTIFYNQGTQRYDLEQTLKPDEQMWIDVGKLIREHVRDKNGNVLPENLTSGSYEIRDLIHKGIGSLFEGKVTYDKTYGHVAYGCGSCCGNKNVRVSFNPLGVPFQGSSDDGVTATDSCSLQNVDVSDSFYGAWNTANHAIATADYYGTHTGVSVGSTTSSTYGQLQVYERVNVCPIQGRTPSGGADVTNYAQISSTGLSPYTSINLHASPTCTNIQVQVYHTDLTSVGQQTATLTVATYSYNPATGFAVTYQPGAQPITLTGTAGSQTFQSQVCSSTGSGTVVIQATLAQPSSGIMIQAPNPVTNARTTLTVSPN